ncbi:MAG TPA: 2-amino-4-hydroxy-6-hydroxymethyldihydropteridine diphosphokinase [Rhodospirillaceae bacterium]|mgnify:FL=1|nr:2-amino-4-hydroxy-6-hydroxymethyldihydropteridine diphosphokinase [Rhodospirillaceae bacterium]MAX62854.1 2-amino-4-hydroxy-6-hydroxymethyldihydropteridine diphosphokinase [Rhodospirillaceae bacterium]MBB57700.1 2-amino-4-hydroxy-6-hydroxymethyldihydropteridine diphosphokinase [Rhodospirillaceae bacterium]HBM11473.1 2-amino-4-hydroxy-6-hydroxymethyldihydropteridine diphosphokinase [Rhodospirillaceae bacterium]|tara:strand:- start:41947 stop:42426 length:480 start_codon:yes stop_codon:yes gene_type:complete
MVRVYLALGGNLGDRHLSLRTAIERLQEHVAIDQQSGIYETAPMYVADQPAFLNMVVSGVTDLTPLALLDFLKRLESEIGRVPSVVNGPRQIDLDILFYGDTVLDSDRLTLPHPRIAERAFVLVPLCDIAPDLIGPTENRSISVLLAQVPGRDTVQLCV